MKFDILTFSSIASYISVYILGVLTQMLRDDSSSIVHCRMDVMDLEDLLTSLRYRLSDSHRRPESDVEKIREFKKLLRQLNVHYAGLFIGHLGLKDLIGSSLDRIRDYEKDKGEPQNAPHNTGVDLLELWGRRINQGFEATKIRELEHFLHGNLLKRMWLRALSFASRIKKKFSTA